MRLVTTLEKQRVNTCRSSTSYISHASVGKEVVIGLQMYKFRRPIPLRPQK